MNADPSWLVLARGEIGTKEKPGPGNNPEVVQYYVESVGRKHPDSVPWCAAFVGAMISRAGYKPSYSLLARSYLDWGVRLKAPKVGAVVVFARGKPPSGHVGFVESFTDNVLVVIGGNQKDAVNRQLYSRSKAIGYRWPT